MKISIIAAVSENGVIGKTGALPWYLPADLKHFKEVTTGHHIVMGSVTHESIGKALPNRTNIVLSDNPSFKAPDCVVVSSINEAIDYTKNRGETEVFIIGGASVYKQTIDLADKLYITKILSNIEGDKYFPKINEDEWKMLTCEKHTKDEKNKYDYEFCEYEKVTLAKIKT